MSLFQDGLSEDRGGRCSRDYDAGLLRGSSGGVLWDGSFELWKEWFEG